MCSTSIKAEQTKRPLPTPTGPQRLCCPTAGLLTRRARPDTVWLMIPALAAALVTATPAVPATSPVIVAPPVLPAPPQAEHAVLNWLPAQATCAGAPAPTVVAPAPYPFVTRATAAAAAQPRAFTFMIDASGQPHSIAPEGVPFVSFTGDLSPALAASRFEAGRERQGCVIRFSPTVVPVERADARDAYAAVVLGSGVRSRQLFERMFPVGSTCVRPRPAPQLTAHPEYKTLPKVPGQRQFSMVAFDVDTQGVPVGARVAGGTGHAKLDRASVDAIGRSRFEPGARRGCVYPYLLNADRLPAPSAPDTASMRPAGSTCPATLHWETKPTLVFPPAYLARAIEGWAIVAFDVAPWGATGNVRALAAQPAAEFGLHAVSIVQGARKPASARGHVGCVTVVRFNVPDLSAPGAEPAVD